MTHTSSLKFPVFALWAVLLAAPFTPAADPAPSAEQIEFFEKQIRPLLVAHCVKCHGEKSAEGGLRLDSREALARGIEGLPVVIAGQPDKSRLIEVTRYDGAVQMPPDKKLSEKEFAALVQWVKSGAPWPTGTTHPPASAANSESPDFAARVSAARKTHWAFQPVQRPQPPAVSAGNRLRAASPIDLFLLQKLEAVGLSFSPVAERRTWLRRLTFDLTGLPPTFDELESFQADDRPDAAARAADRLLASPHYGERWGRHWLDLARYSDTKGYVFQQERRFPYAYTYRDYVVRSFNEDLPYDQFVREQLVADQLPPRDDNRSLAALGFLTVGRHFSNVHDDIDDRIDVVTRGLLGLTVTCARCHDHKYEAVPSEDYYSLYGVFRSCLEPEELPRIGTPVPSPEYDAYLAELNKREAALRDGMAEETENVRRRMRTNIGDYLAVSVLEPRGREAVLKYKGFAAGEPWGPQAKRWRDFLAQPTRANDPVFAPWRRLLKFEKSPPDEFKAQAAQTLKELRGDEKLQPNSHVLDALEQAAATSIFDVAQAYGRLLASPPDEQLRQAIFGPQAPGSFPDSDARELFEVKQRDRMTKLKKEIEQWQVTSDAAPPRAMVLHDAPKPFQPYVFIRGSQDRHGKTVPRQFLAVLSGEQRTPFSRGSGRAELATAITDPRNPLTSRVLVNRLWQHHFGTGLVDTPSNFGERGDAPSHPELLDYLAAEFITRDWSVKALHREMLLSTAFAQSSRRFETHATAAQIDPDNRLLSRMNRQRLEFEPSRDAMLFAARQLDQRIGGKPVDLMTQPFTRRRTLYGKIDRQELATIFQTFDFASPDVSTEQRPETTVPQQTLFAMNSPFVTEQSRRLAALPEITNEKDEAMRIDALYRAALSRRATAEEIAAARKFVGGVQPAGSSLTSWEMLAQVLLLTNEFLFVD